MEAAHDAAIRDIFQVQGLASPRTITPFSSGQINYVYDIDNQYVIKIEGKEAYTTGIFGHQEELMRKLSDRGVKVPRVIATGNEPVKFLLMEKIEGDNLINGYYALPRAQKRLMIEQIAGEMRLIHTVGYDRFATSTYTGNTFSTLREAYDDHYRSLKVTKEKFPLHLQKALASIEDFYKTNQGLLDDPALRPVCIHGDFHFGNIFVKDGKVTGVIDWDWSAQMPKEYELLNVLDFSYQPYKFVEESLEPKYQSIHAEEMQWLQQSYPELFAHPHLLDLVRLFHLPQFVDYFYWYEHGRWSDGVMADVQRWMQFVFGEGLVDLLKKR